LTNKIKNGNDDGPNDIKLNAQLTDATKLDGIDRSKSAHSSIMTNPKLMGASHTMIRPSKLGYFEINKMIG